MSRKRIIIIISAVAVSVVLIILFRPKKTIPHGVVAVKPFEVERYLGKWFEIARFDYRFEKNLNQVTAEYSQNDDGTISVVNRGYNYQEKEWKQATGKAKFVRQKNEAMLKVSFFGPFYSGYNVVAIDPDYKYALVAGESLDYLWILSREKTIPREIRDSYRQKAASIGYDTSKLIWVEH